LVSGSNPYPIDFTEETHLKVNNNLDFAQILLCNMEEIGNDFDVPDEDLINLINSTFNNKNKEKSLEKLRKSSISIKYNVEPIQEENTIDYIIPLKKKSFLMFLERNDIYGKISYNKNERKSLFKDIYRENDDLENEFDNAKGIIDNFRKRFRSMNSLKKKVKDKENGIKFILLKGIL